MKIREITPMLATLTDKPFDGEEWIFEIKWDGYRILAFKNDETQLITRGHQNFTSVYSAIAKEVSKIKKECLLDGEVVILDDQGRPNFQLLQNFHRDKTGAPLYYVFDLLYCDGEDLTSLPLIERKTRLKQLFKGSRFKYVKYCEHIEARGKAFFEEARKLGLEGIIAKRKESTYQFYRSKSWLKIKTGMRQEVVIGGFTAPRGGRKRFGALLVGVYENRQLVYSGHVGGGFNESLLEEVYSKLQPLIIETCPFQRTPIANAAVTWVKPKLVCEVAFAEWTKEGIMRQPIFKGLRIDKKPSQVVREKIS